MDGINARLLFELDRAEIATGATQTLALVQNIHMSKVDRAELK